jgi:hypothetical protein
MEINWFNKKDNDCVITLSKEDFKNGEFNLNLKLKDYKRNLQKGDLIKFNLGSKMIAPESKFANEYRVLKVDGNKAYIVSMYELNRMEFGNSQKYFGNDIDRFLEYGFYNSLSEKAKDAIITNSIAQNYFGSNDSRDKNRYSSYANKLIDRYGDFYSRHIALLDYQDVLEYFNYKFSEEEIYKTFFKGQIYGRDRSFWLRSARSDYSDIVWYVDGYSGYVSNYYYDNRFAVRPAFKIDLSKIDWEFVDED